jgi:pyridoxamine 5'-phosphate oxidase
MSAENHKDLGGIRREYSLDRLDESQLPEDPMILFHQWLDQARNTKNPEPTAMTLSTVDQDGNPSSRIVLLKKIAAGRLWFFTNYESRKAREMESHSRVAVHFHWPELERQLRMEGTVSRIPETASDQYFHSRPRESQIAAWASPQSKEVPDRDFLEKEQLRYQEKYKSTREIPRPANWGGYAVSPLRMEFWQGGQFRLHDRIAYGLHDQGWSRIRLAP